MSLAQKAVIPTAEAAESPESKPPTSYGGVDLSDFAPLRPIQSSPADGATQQRPQQPLECLPESENEDNIPGAQEIRSGGHRTPVPQPINPDITHQAQQHNHHHHHHTKQGLKAKNTKNSDKNRRLADTKPCSYPNLLVTRTNDLHKDASNHLNGTGAHPSSDTFVALRDCKGPAPDANSFGSSSMRAKSQLQQQQGQHLSSAGGPNVPKDAKCSIFWLG